MSGFLWGLDLSLSNSGIAIIDLNTYQPIHIDSIKTNAKLEHKDRLKQITDKFDELIIKYPPSVIAIENGFVRHNNATKILFKVRGVTERWFYNIEQHYYAPTTVKATILHGQASKEKIKEVLQKKYPEIEIKDNDQADALGVAITYLVKHKLIKWNKRKIK